MRKEWEMINEFFDWLFDYGRDGIAMLFMFFSVVFLLGFFFAFVAFVMPMPLLRFELLTATIPLSIFMVWYFRVYKK